MTLPDIDPIVVERVLTGSRPDHPITRDERVEVCRQGRARGLTDVAIARLIGCDPAVVARLVGKRQVAA